MDPKAKSRKVYVLSPEEQKLRYARNYLEEYLNYLWRKEEVDPFDLRYLFDEEEIQENRNKLIREYEYDLNVNPFYNELLYENDENEEEEIPYNRLPYGPMDQFMIEENWDYAETGIRYNFLAGFMPGYDSGVDEPLLRHIPYQDEEEKQESEEDEEALNERRAHILQVILQRAEERRKISNRSK